MRLVAAVAVVVATGCGGAAAGSPPGAPGATSRELSPSSCGSLARIDLDETPTALLADHLRIRMPRGARRLAAGGPLGATPPDALETQIEIADGEGEEEAKMRVIAMELFRRPGDDFSASVIRWLEDDAAPASPLALAPPLEGIFIAAEESSDEGMAFVGRAVVIGEERTIVDLSFFASQRVIDAEGVAECAGLARRIAGTLSAGERRIDVAGGRIALSPAVSMDLRPGYATLQRPGRDFEVHYFYPLMELDAPHAQLGVYLGNEPSSHIRDVLEMRSLPGAMLGQSVEWQAWTTARRGRRVTHMETMLEIPGQGGLWAHAFLVAENPAMADELRAMAETLSLSGE